MRFSLGRLRPMHLAVGTLAYWAGLAVIKLSHPLLVAWRLTHLPPGQSSIEASYAESAVHVVMKQLDAVVWSGSISAGGLIIWLFGPPALVIGAWWLSAQSEESGTTTDRGNIGPGSEDRALPGSGIPPAGVNTVLHPEREPRSRRRDG